MKCSVCSFLFVLLQACGLVYGQQQHVFVASASNAIFGDTHNILSSIDLSNCSSRYIDTLPLGVYTIACTPNGKLWAMANDTVGANLYQVDTVTGQLTFRGYFDTHNDFVQSMGVLNDSVLLIQCQSDLYGVTTTNVHSFRIGTVGNYRFGDMTWLGQDLYIMGCGGNPDSMYLLKVTFNNNSYPPIAGAALVGNNISIPYCYALATIVLSNTDTALIGFADSNAYVINPIDGSYTLQCSVLADSLGHFSDAATINYPTVPIVIDTTHPTGITVSSIPESGLKLYPNPVSKVLNINYQNSKAILLLTDITGRTVLRKQLFKGIQQVDMTLFAAGQYIATIEAENGMIYRQKIVKD